MPAGGAFVGSPAGAACSGGRQRLRHSNRHQQAGGGGDRADGGDRGWHPERVGKDAGEERSDRVAKIPPDGTTGEKNSYGNDPFRRRIRGKQGEWKGGVK